jgi:hypothetical protein
MHFTPPPAFSIIAACALFGAATAAAADGFAFKDTAGDHLDVLHDGKIVARYMYASDNSTKERRLATYKPYLHVFDAEGKEPITKGPGGDLPHHRAVCVGWNGIQIGAKKYDRWHMPDGEQVHEKFLAQTAEPTRATFTSQIRWTGRKDEPPILMEERTFTFLPAPAPAYALIELTTTLKAVAGDTSLNPDPEHSGLQFRPAQEIDKTQTVFVLPGEKTNAHKDRDLPWAGESFTLRGQRFSVVQFNHPGNPKPVLTSAYRDYGRFGLTFATKIAANAEATYRCRFLVGQGEMFPAEQIQKLANEFTGASDPTPKVTVNKAEGFGATAKPKAPARPKEAPKPAPAN